jgi:hypothetical protein
MNSVSQKLPPASLAILARRANERARQLCRDAESPHGPAYCQEATPIITPKSSAIALSMYIRQLADPSAIEGPYLPPSPPTGLQAPERGIAWAAWWDAVEEQRRLNIVTEPPTFSSSPHTLN